MTLRTTKLIASMTFGKTCKLIMGRTAAVQHTGGCGEGCRGAPGEGLQLQSGAANLRRRAGGTLGLEKATAIGVWSYSTWGYTAAQKSRALLPCGQHTNPSLGLVPQGQHSTQQAALRLSCCCFGGVQSLL